MVSVDWDERQAAGEERAAIRENVMPDLGMIAYEAFGAVTEGDLMPAWEDLPPLIRQAWDAASQAVLKA